MKYRTIVADPPWPIAWGQDKPGGMRRGGKWGQVKLRPLHRSGLGYPTMAVAAIENLPVPDLVGAEAALFLWTVDRYLLDGTAAGIATAWGFDRLRIMVWSKPGFGMGAFPRPAHEHIIIGLRGRAAFSGSRSIRSIQEWPSPYGPSGNSVARVHSSKPEAFLDLVESVSPGPYLEMFARRQRLGWDTWGNEALNHVDLAEKSIRSGLQETPAKPHDEAPTGLEPVFQSAELKADT